MVLGLAAATALAMAGLRKRLRRLRDVIWRRTVAIFLVSIEGIGWLIAASQGSLRIPLQLCDMALFATAWALWNGSAGASEVAYFWALAGSLQAVLTPDLSRGFPDPWSIKFFLVHCGVVLSAVYLAVTGRVQPTARSVWRMWALTNGYAAVAGMANWVWGTNYGYLARKPMQPSLLDYFGPWPWYIVGLEAAALVSFYIYYLPFVAARRWRLKETA